MNIDTLVRRVRVRLYGDKRPVYTQLRQYGECKSVRFPLPAGRHQREMELFIQFSGIRDIAELTLEDVVTYVDSINGQYGRKSFVSALRQFLKFCKQVGYANIQVEDMKGKIRMEKVHSLLDVDQVLRVKKLRARTVDGAPMSYRKIKAYMEKKDGRKYDIKNIYKWANYELPAGYGLSTT